MSAQTLVELLCRRGQQFRDKPAFRFVRDQHSDPVGVTYGQLDDAARAIAGELQTRTEPGDRAWLLFPPGVDSIAAFFGCLYAGVVAVPLSPPRARRYSGALRAILEASAPALVMTSSDHLAQAAQLYGELPELQELPWLASDAVSPERRTQWQEPQVGADDIAFLQYTSGSTATPKGVMLSHANLLHNSALIGQAFGTAEDGTAVFWLPLYHDMGLIGGVIQPIYCGGSCTLLAPAAFLQRPRLWLETISSQRAEISGGPDFAYDVCARKIGPEERRGLDLSCWRLAFTGAEPIRAGTLDRFADAFRDCGFRREAFLPVYGLAEGTLMVTGGPRGRSPTVIRVDGSSLANHRIREVDEGDGSVRSIVSSGDCLPGQRVVIVDPHHGRPCGQDEVGEIWVRGASVAQGYFRQQEATQRTFCAFLGDPPDGPYLRTGDLGFVRDGQLFVTGRLKDLIIIRGRNYYPDDLEATIDAIHPSFRAGHCVAFSAEIEDQERLIIVQEIEPRVRTVDSEAAFQAIRQAISTVHELEVHAIVLAKAGAIPKTTSGKRRRSTCRDLFLANQLEQHARWTAEHRNGCAHPLISRQPAVAGRPTPKEIASWLTQRIAARLSLDISQIQLHKPFTELGMGSLDAVEITADLGQWLQRPLSPTIAYNHPNIASLADWLATASDCAEPMDASCVTTPAVFEASQVLREIRAMSRDEIERALRQELAKQEG